MIKSNRLLIMLALLTVYSIARGATNEIEPAGAGYFVVDYSDGFIRRGLVGQIFSLVFLRNQASAAWATAVVIHHLLVMLLGAGLLAWLWSTMWTTRLFTPGRLVAIYCLFAASEFLPTLSATAGYLDSYVYLLALVCFVAASSGNIWLASAFGTVGPVIHEMFLFFWLSLMIMLLWKEGLTKFRNPVFLAACVMPFLSAAAVMYFHSQAAVIAQMAHGPLAPDWAAEMTKWQFGNSLAADLSRMARLYIGHPVRFVLTLVGFGFPTALMLGLAWLGLAWLGLAKFPIWRSVLPIVAACLPLGILVLAWDLSRLTVASEFAAMLCILFMASSSSPNIASPVGLRRCERASTIIVTAVMLPLPLVYGYFDRTLVVRNAVLESLPLTGPFIQALIAKLNGSIS